MERRAQSSSGARKLAALSLLYLTQGIPFGIAAEYVPVLLREEHYTRTDIALVGWLQLPWQLKVLWAHAGDHPRLRPHTRSILCSVQLALAATIALTGLGGSSRAMFFAAIGASAFFAATQDVFVDALAIRSLAPHERGWGNTAQVAGYRMGMLAGGAGLLVLAHRAWGPRPAFLGLAAIVAAVAIGTFALDASTATARSTSTPITTSAATSPSPLSLLTHVVHHKTCAVAIIALTFKLGLHVVGGLLKPAMVDAKWTPENIATIITVSTVCALLGAGCGGWAHRRLGEPRALRVMCVAQFSCTLPLLVMLGQGMPLGLGQVAIAVEHFVSGAGTTVLFAALMSASRPSQASLHYTVLTSLNAVGIGVSGIGGGLIADHGGAMTGFAAGSALCLLPLLVLRDWANVAAASAAERDRSNPAALASGG